MPKRTVPDETLRRLRRKRDYVNGQMTAAWEKALPDMAALEVLHYELKNLDYRIATQEPDDVA